MGGGKGGEREGGEGEWDRMKATETRQDREETAETGEIANSVRLR